MKIVVERARLPQWSNEHKSTIDLIVKFSRMTIEVPFTASSGDTVWHGRDIFQRCLAGEFGPIAEPGTYQFDDLIDQVPRPDHFYFRAYQPRDYLEFMTPFVNEANLEAKAGTSRGSLLVSTAMLSRSLGELLDIASAKGRIESNKKVPDDYNGRVNLVSKLPQFETLGFRNDLESIRLLRNAAAHQLLFTEFFHLEDREKECYKFLHERYGAPSHLYSEDMASLRHVFLLACCNISLHCFAMKEDFEDERAVN